MLEKIDMLRRKSGLTQTQVETAASLPVSRISKWRDGQGEPSATQALRLARLFGVPVEYLVDDALKDPESDGLTPDERQLLWLAEQVGAKEAIRRVLNAAAEPAPTPARHPASLSEVESVGILVDAQGRRLADVRVRSGGVISLVESPEADAAKPAQRHGSGGRGAAVADGSGVHVPDDDPDGPPALPHDENHPYHKPKIIAVKDMTASYYREEREKNRPKRKGEGKPKPGEGGEMTDDEMYAIINEVIGEYGPDGLEYMILKGREALQESRAAYDRAVYDDEGELSIASLKIIRENIPDEDWDYAIDESGRRTIHFTEDEDGPVQRALRAEYERVVSRWPHLIELRKGVSPSHRIPDPPARGPEAG